MHEKARKKEEEEVWVYSLSGLSLDGLFYSMMACLAFGLVGDERASEGLEARIKEGRRKEGRKEGRRKFEWIGLDWSGMSTATHE